jgi:DNA-binding NarL/FixJ family response regulator
MRILIADDHALFRDALAEYIQRAKPECKISTARNLEEALDHIERDPDFNLVLLDLRMPGMKGLSGLEKIRQSYPDIPVALMSGLAESDDVKEAINLGAAGYFPKTLSGQAMMKAIELVLAGERFVPLDHHSNTIMASYQNDHRPLLQSVKSYQGLHEEGDDFTGPSKTKLTPREQEVLKHLAKGETNKDIARALDLQVVTVKLHVRGICKKLNATNRTQAALKARTMGLSA